MMSATQSTSAPNQDLEAQRPSTPAPAWSPPPMRMLDPTDAAFGYTLATAPSAGTHESRHDARRTSTGDIPPPYAEEAAIPLPEYSLHAPEPVTLAMFLFKFGFLFPPFWLFGIVILFSDLRTPESGCSCTPTSPSTPSASPCRCPSTSTPSWMPEKSEAERQQIIATMRSAELKWARRCLVASIIFTLLAVAAGVGAWVIRRELA